MSRRLLLASLAVAGLALPAAAEVSVTRPSTGGVVFYFQASETGPWGRVRAEIPTGDMLNPQGDWRADGWPSYALRQNGLPSVAHATAGEDSEIYVAWHDGVAWRTGTNVSRRSGADHGPMIDLDQWGNRFVAWNNSRGSRIAVCFSGVRADGGGLLGVLELTARQREGRKPSLAVYLDGDVYVAYEEQANGNEDVPYLAIDRVLPPRNSGNVLHCSGENTPDWSRVATIRTGLTDRNVLAEATVHREAEHLWVTWIDNRTRMGWVELMSPGVFSEPSYRPFDPTAGPASALTYIRDQVLAP